MVAETHSTNDDLSFDAVVAFIVSELGGIDAPGDPGAVTLGECGFEMTLDFVDLSRLVGEEFGERTLSAGDLDDVDATTSVADFVADMYPDLADRGVDVDG